MSSVIKNTAELVYNELSSRDNKMRVKSLIINPIINTIKEWIFPYLILMILLFIIIIIVCIQCLNVTRAATQFDNNAKTQFLTIS